MTSNPNDKLNFLVVCGLYAIALSTVLSMAIIYAQTKTVQSEFVLIVSNIASGMVGFLSREYRTTHGAGGSSIDASSAENVTVTNPPAEPAVVVEAEVNNHD